MVNELTKQHILTVTELKYSSQKRIYLTFTGHIHNPTDWAMQF